MHKISLVATDLDGTLFHDRMHITPRDRAMIDTLHAEGIPLVFATGRGLEGVTPALDRLDLWDAPRYIIHSGGGGIFDMQSRTDSLCGDMDVQTLQDIADRYLDCGIPLIIAQGDVLYTSQMTDLLREEARLLQFQLQMVPDFRTVLMRPNNKVMLCGTDEQIARVLPIATADPDPRYHFFRSHDHYIDCGPAGVDKGAALRSVCEILGVPLAETLAIGDNLNDAELLQTAGHASCPGDGHPDIFPLVDFIACPAHEGAFADSCAYFLGK